MSDPNYRDPIGADVNRRKMSDPEQAGRSGATWSVVAICVIVVLGAAFYYWGGPNTHTASNAPMNTASTSSTVTPSTQPSTAPNPSAPAATPSAPASPPANSP